MKRAGKHVWSVEVWSVEVHTCHMPREHMPRANMYPCRTRQVSSLSKTCGHMSACQQRLQSMWSSVCYTLLSTLLEMLWSGYEWRPSAPKPLCSSAPLRQSTAHLEMQRRCRCIQCGCIMYLISLDLMYPVDLSLLDMIDFEEMSYRTCVYSTSKSSLYSTSLYSTSLYSTCLYRHVST